MVVLFWKKACSCRNMESTVMRWRITWLKTLLVRDNNVIAITKFPFLWYLCYKIDRDFFTVPSLL